MPCHDPVNASTSWPPVCNFASRNAASFASPPVDRNIALASGSGSSAISSRANSITSRPRKPLYRWTSRPLASLIAAVIAGWPWPSVAHIWPEVKSSTRRPSSVYSHAPSARSTTNGANWVPYRINMPSSISLILTCQHRSISMSSMDVIVSSAAAAYDVLRAAVVRVELAPGQAVSEVQLAERFGISKAAVRAALGRLRVDGLVVAEPRRGHTVAPLTLRDVIEIYDLRAILEPAAAAAAAGRMPAGQLAQLRRRTAPDTDFDDGDAAEHLMQVNRAVHVAVADAGGNRRLAADRGEAAG